MIIATIRRVVLLVVVGTDKIFISGGLSNKKEFYEVWDLADIS